MRDVEGEGLVLPDEREPGVGLEGDLAVVAHADPDLGVGAVEDEGPYDREIRWPCLVPCHAEDHCRHRWQHRPRLRQLESFRPDERLGRGEGPARGVEPLPPLRQAAGAFVVLRNDVVNTGDDVRGPRALRPREAFRNLGDADAGAFVGEGPCDAFARKCREAFGDVALFLRDAREPKRMAVVWRPGFDGDARQVLRAVAALGVSVVKRVEVVG